MFNHIIFKSFIIHVQIQSMRFKHTVPYFNWIINRYFLHANTNCFTMSSYRPVEICQGKEGVVMLEGALPTLTGGKGAGH